jgi:sarcosine oxidase subunit gamma
MLNRVAEFSPLIRVQSWERNGVTVPDEVERLLQLEWPARAGDVASGRVDVICINPSDWLVSAAPAVSADELLQALHTAFGGASLRAVDVSAALARIRLAGPAARGVLTKTCALDVQSSNVVPGRAPRTLIGGIPVILHCLEPSSFECIVSQSYAEYFMAWMHDAAAELT